MAIQGVIFSDIFVSNKEQFVRIFSKYYKDNEKQLQPIINRLNTFINTDLKNLEITEKTEKDFKQIWYEFETKVLLNENQLELLVVYRDQSKGGKASELSRIVPQSKVQINCSIYTDNELLKLGRDLGTDIESSRKARRVENMLRRHIAEYLDFLNTRIGAVLAWNIHKYHESDLLQEYQNTDVLHISPLKWYAAFFNDEDTYYSGQGLGRAYDSFMQHLANREKDVFEYLRSRGTSEISQLDNLLNINRKTVFEEENGVGPNGNFTRMLKSGTNNIPWFTGGDIVIIDPKTMHVVYNIQLKTTSKNIQGTFGIAISKLNDFLKAFTNPESTYQQKAEAIFHYFVTEISNDSDFNSLPKETAERTVEEELMKNPFLKKK